MAYLGETKQKRKKKLFDYSSLSSQYLITHCGKIIHITNLILIG